MYSILNEQIEKEETGILTGYYKASLVYMVLINTFFSLFKF